MSVSDLYTNRQYFELKLLPRLQALKDKRVKCKPVLATIGAGQHPLRAEEWLLNGPAIRHPGVGFDPTNLRASCADNPQQMAEFLRIVALGKLHISCWQYLIGMATQVEFRAGLRPSYGSLVHDSGAPQAPTATDKIMKGVDENIAIDDDYRRIAKKRDFDQKFREKLMADRPYLLGGK